MKFWIEVGMRRSEVEEKVGFDVKSNSPDLKGGEQVCLPGKQTNLFRHCLDPNAVVGTVSIH